MSQIRIALAMIFVSTPGLVAWALPPAPAPRPDAFGDPLPPGAVARVGTARFRASAEAGALYSADGKLLVTSDGTRYVSVWDADGKEVRRFRIPYTYPQLITLSPDAKFLLLNMFAQSCYLWDVATGKEVWGLGKDVSVSSAGFLPDGKSLVVAARRGAGPQPAPEIVLRETATGKEIRRFEGGAGLVRLSPDGKILATGVIRRNRQGAALWDVSTGKRLHEFDIVPDHEARALAFSPDGRSLAVGWRAWGLGAVGVVRRWDVHSGKQVGERIEWWERDIQFVAYSSDSKELLTVNDRGQCSVWNATTGREVRRPEIKLPGGERSVTVSPDGKTLVTGGRRLRLWDLATGKERQPLRPRPEYFRALSPDGATVATGDGDGSLRLWDGTTGKLRHTIVEKAHGFPETAFSPDGKVLTACLADRSVRQWDSISGKEIRTLATGLGGTRIAYFDDGRSVLGLSWPNKILAWDAATGKPRNTNGWMRPDGDRAWGDTLLAADGRVLAAALSPPDSPRDLPDPPGTRGIFLWDRASGKLLRSMRDPAGEARPKFRHLAVSEDARFAAALDSSSSVHVWDATTGIHLWRFPQRRPRYADLFIGVALAPDGSLLAAAQEDGTVGLREVATGIEVHQFVGHRGPLLRVAFSADGRVLASGGTDGNVLLWDVTGQVLRPEKPAAKEFPALWDDLSGDAAKAYRAQCRLIASADAAAFLLERLVATRPVTDAKRVARLVAGLDSDRFETREAASKALERLGRQPEGALRAAVRGDSSAEVKRRADKLLAWLQAEVPSADSIRIVRAVAALERMGGRVARPSLAELAKGPEYDEAATLARAALRRLARHSAANP